MGKCTGYTQEVNSFILSSRKRGRGVSVCVYVRARVCLVKEVWQQEGIGDGRVEDVPTMSFTI